MDRERGFSNIRIIPLYLIIILTVSAQAEVMEDDPDANTTIRIAIFQMAPEEGNFTVNHETIEKAITISSDQGADWFITPEMAESGYEFVDTISPDQLNEFPSPWFSRLQRFPVTGI